VKKVALLADDAGLNDGSENNSQSAAICMQMAERIKAELVKRHIDVDMIRSSDSYVPLGKKLQEIESSKAQLLLVISVGSSADFVDLGGYRILYMNSSVDYNSLHSKTLDASEQVAPEMIYQSFEKNSKVLASAIKNSLTRLLDREPVGMNPGPLYLARRAPMAAATVVIGYLTNPADARRLTDSSQQNSMAQAIAQGIADYSNLLGQGQSGSAGESH
jgi:N-acetylmuramoyl-L-alanine amidase